MKGAPRTIPPDYAWVGGLGAREAHGLGRCLVEAITGGVSLEALQTRVTGWRAQGDGYRERRLPRASESEAVSCILQQKTNVRLQLRD